MNVSRLEKFLSQFRFGLKMNKLSVTLEKTSLAYSILELFLAKGFINGFFICDNKIIVFLRFFGFKNILRLGCQVSKSSSPFYLSFNQLCFFLKGFRSRRFYIISTPLGFFFSNDALKYSLGGEVLFYIY
jgi:ribosomal protein S8